MKIREWIHKNKPLIFISVVLILTILGIAYLVGQPLFDCLANGNCPPPTNMTTGV